MDSAHSGACKILIDKIVHHIQTVIKDLLHKARELFKKLGSKQERKLLEHEAPDLCPLQRRYVGENDPKNPLRAFGNKVVHYMDDAERAQYKLAVKDGKLLDATGKPSDTALGTSFSGQPGRAIYVMDKDRNLYASMYQERGVMQHSSFLAGAPVAGAGELVVEDGTLRTIALRSGHYTPTYGHQDYLLRTPEQQGVDISQVVREGPEDL